MIIPPEYNEVFNCPVCGEGEQYDENSLCEDCWDRLIENSEYNMN